MVNGTIFFGNIIIWAISAAIYRLEKDKGGKHNDLWGWTCSGPADAIQTIFKDEINFNTYCNAQVRKFILELYFHDQF
jgi:hypothetical protein